MSKVEVFMPHMRGTCVTVGSRTHGLFLLNLKYPARQRSDPPDAMREAVIRALLAASPDAPR